MKVTVLTRAAFPYHGYGGSERHIYHLIRHLKRRGVDVRLYTSRPVEGWREATFPFFREPDVPTQFVRGRFLPLGRRRGTVILDRAVNYPLLAERMGALAARDVRQGRADIVYAQGIAGLGYAIRKKLGRLKAPVLHNPQGMEEFKTSNRAKWLAYAPLRFYARRFARLADCVIASDDCMRSEVETFLRPRQIRVLRNGVDLEECTRLTLASEQESLVKRFELHETECIGLTVARLEENKGIAHLLQALHDLRRFAAEPASWKWFIVGDGPEADRLHATSRELGLDGRVIFTGRVSDMVVHNLYELAEVFCLPSLFEGSSIATLEAMAHGCAVVASNVGGLPDKVVDGRNGFLTLPGSGDAIATALSRVVGNREIRMQMAEESRRMVQQRFSWDVVVGEALQLFEDVIARRRA